MDLLQCYSTDFAFFSETWLPSSTNVTTATIKQYSYQCFHSDQFGRWKGCALVVSNKWSDQINNHKKILYSSFEASQITFNDVNKTHLISVYRYCVYGSQFNIFLEEFQSFLSDLIMNGRNFVLCGDLNIHYNIPSESYTYRFQDLMDELGLMVTAPLVPTHDEGNTIDLIISNVSTASQIKLQSVDPHLRISDHHPIVFELKLYHKKAIPNKRKIIQTRNCKNVDFAQFNSDLDNACHSTHIPESNDNFGNFLQIFTENVTSCLNNHAPIYSKVIKIDTDKPPWIDGEYISERCKRRALEKKYRISKSHRDWCNYQAQSTHCRNIFKSKRNEYIGSTIRNIEGDQRKLFNFVNNITDCKMPNDKLPTRISDPHELANKFNSFFIDKINKIRQEFPNSTPPMIHELNDSEWDNSSYLSVLSPCTIDELRELIKIHGITVSPNDILPGLLMEKSIETLLPYILKLINLSLATGCFDGLKEAIVRPTFKKDASDLEDFSNFRPVSNLPFISKLIERVVQSRLQAHMDLINYNCDTQFGYKKFHGTETLLVKLVNDLLIGLDSRSGIVLVLIDLSAAFDTVDHNKLINILANELNIRNTALKWFKSYLSNRTQRVYVNGQFSEPLELSFGVPQGSVLGPILFNIYVKSLANVFLNAGFNTLSYADDNSGYQVFSFSAASNIFLESIPNLLSDISKWMQDYYLKLNEDKTKVIVFGSRQFNSNLPSNSVSTLNGEVIDCVSKVKYLGVYLDDTLTMQYHINKVTSQCYCNLRKINGIRSLLSQQQCELLINATVTSRLDYCNALFFKLSWSNRLSKLAKIQNYASKIILQKGRRQGLPAIERLVKLHWLPIKQRIVYKVLLLTFKCIIKKAPMLLISLLTVNSNSRHANTLSTNIYYPLNSNGQRAFSYYAPKLWNALPLNMRNIELLPEFKAKLKTHLFSHFDELMARFNMYRL